MIKNISKNINKMQYFNVTYLIKKFTLSYKR